MLGQLSHDHDSCPLAAVCLVPIHPSPHILNLMVETRQTHLSTHQIDLI
jgi:hypothetical protein